MILKALKTASPAAPTPGTCGLTERRRNSMYQETPSMEIRKKYVKTEYPDMVQYSNPESVSTYSLSLIHISEPTRPY